MKIKYISWRENKRLLTNRHTLEVELFAFSREGFIAGLRETARILLEKANKFATI